MEIIGYKNYVFSPENGSDIEMVQIFYTYGISKGVGKGCRSIQMSKAKIEKAGIELHVGPVKNFIYDWHGKVIGITYEA